eukprot:GHVO01027574.1.p3 GENE.GHVO01027574.1~~GHVO01027574.1.p3  ORF type:complete len:102 (+),score=11.99 GHVO01027574.1:712-1017(+)
MSLALAFIKYKISKKWAIVGLVMFSASTSMAMGIGMLLSGAGDIFAGVFDALCAGFVLYIATEMSSDVFRSTNNQAYKMAMFVMMCLGVGLVAGAALMKSV